MQAHMQKAFGASPPKLSLSKKSILGRAYCGSTPPPAPSRQIVKSSATLFRKEFKRRKIAKALSGAIVDNGDDPSDLLVRDVMEVTAFRKEEAEHVIRALIQATLPRSVRVAKIEGGAKILFDAFEVTELRASIERDGLHSKRKFGKPERIFDRASDVCGDLVITFTRNKELALTINERDQASLAGCTQDRITFKVAETLLGLTLYRSFVDRMLWLKARLRGVSCVFPNITPAKIGARGIGPKHFILDRMIDC